MEKLTKELLVEVADQRRAEQALRISEQRFRAVFESAAECIFLTDGRLRYTRVNRAVTSLLGVPQSKKSLKEASLLPSSIA